MSESFTMVKNSDIILAYWNYKEHFEKELEEQKNTYIQELMQSKKGFFGFHTKKGMTLEEAQESWVAYREYEEYFQPKLSKFDRLYALASYDPHGKTALHLSDSNILSWIK
jgi:hypothetical protein